jgi:hypothetical protein
MIETENAYLWTVQIGRQHNNRICEYVGGVRRRKQAETEKETIVRDTIYTTS